VGSDNTFIIDCGVLLHNDDQVHAHNQRQTYFTVAVIDDGKSRRGPTSNQWQEGGKQPSTTRLRAMAKKRAPH